MGMGVDLRRASVGGPAGMADSGVTLDRLRCERTLELKHLFLHGDVFRTKASLPEERVQQCCFGHESLF